MVNRKSPKFTEEGDGIVQPIWTVCWDKIVRCLPAAGIEENRHENVTTFRSIFSKLDVKIPADLVKERLQDQGCTPYFQSVHLSMSRSGVVAGGCTPCVKDFV